MSIKLYQNSTISICNSTKLWRKITICTKLKVKIFNQLKVVKICTKLKVITIYTKLKVIIFDQLKVADNKKLANE